MNVNSGFHCTLPDKNLFLYFVWCYYMSIQYVYILDYIKYMKQSLSPDVFSLTNGYFKITSFQFFISICFQLTIEEITTEKHEYEL